MLRISSTYAMLFLFGVCYHTQSLPYKKSFEVCDKFLYLIDCYYFACIDSIYQCGPNNILVQFAYHFCEATLDPTYSSPSSLSSSGQIWAHTAQKCLMQKLDHLLKSNSSPTCTEIDRYVLNKYPVCLAQSHPTLSLCSIVCNDLEIFFDIFENWDVTGLSLKRLLLETSQLCPERSQMEYVIDLEQSDMRIIFWSLCLDSLKTKFRNFHPNEVMIRLKEYSGMFEEVIEVEE